MVVEQKRGSFRHATTVLQRQKPFDIVLAGSYYKIWHMSFVMLFLFPFAYSQCLARLDPSDAEGDFSSSDEVVDVYLLCLPPRSDG